MVEKTWYYGTIYYASQKAKRDRLVKEKRKATISSYHSVLYITDNFIQIDFDSSGQSYVHMQLSPHP